MDSDTASRGSLWGLATLASFCCVGSGTVAVAGGTAVAGGAAVGGLSSGVVQLAVSIVTLGLIGMIVRWRATCSNCEA
ncbi:hypothetical protein [Natrinema hispanicum]|uniref:Uncharacterized protein n=1 Tax=Natrinema hispanicum TaxID=392421 RepID=A0A1G6MA89_9EURY|nr:hypothetical protein [Natrinema hispanicum]SDC52247.1 hypothetical protein SAMN05192552_1004229 [Natrinema hispanicum]SET15782.1 hypothetical protein SAMN04488694_10473 [Natrinema hispanicum]